MSSETATSQQRMIGAAYFTSQKMETSVIFNQKVDIKVTMFIYLFFFYKIDVGKLF